MTTPIPARPTPRASRTVLLGAFLIGVIALTIVLLLSLSATQDAAQTPTTSFRATNTPNAGAGESITLIDPGQTVPAFTLPASTGAMLSLDDLRGKTVLLYFGYTNCPDFCPITLSQFAAVRAQLGDLADEVQGVMISVDPARDTRDILAQYVTQFDPSFIGLQGEAAVLETLVGTFGLAVTVPTDQAEAHVVDHTVNSYLIDRDGLLRVVFSFGVPTGEMTDAVRTILTETDVTPVA